MTIESTFIVTVVTRFPSSYLISAYKSAAPNAVLDAALFSVHFQFFMRIQPLIPVILPS